MRLVKNVVSVVPDDHESKVINRCEHACSSADDQSRSTAQDLEKFAIPAFGTHVCGQHGGCLARVNHALAHSSDIGRIWHHHDDATLWLRQHRIHEVADICCPRGGRRK
jgi:hypothetical protein